MESAAQNFDIGSTDLERVTSQQSVSQLQLDTVVKEQRSVFVADDIDAPAVFVEPQGSVLWLNKQALDLISNGVIGDAVEDRNFFLLLAQQKLLAQMKGGDELIDSILAATIALFKRIVTVREFKLLIGSAENLLGSEMLIRIYHAADQSSSRQVEIISASRVINGFAFREGILLMISKEGSNSTHVITHILASREKFVTQLMRKRLPVLNRLAVLSADLQNSTAICRDLLPREYVQLCEEVILRTGEICQRYGGTFGKHVGDGVIWFFYERPGMHYLFNALCAADQMRTAIDLLNKEWAARKRWKHKIILNTGINSGQEWVSVNPISGDQMVLGDTVNDCARISDVARNGVILVSKQVVLGMPGNLRQKVKYGMPPTLREGGELGIVDGLFMRVSDYINGNGRASKARLSSKLSDVHSISITELHGISYG